MELPACGVARAHYEGAPNGIAEAYRVFYADWLPDSGFVPAGVPPIEVYLNDCGIDPGSKVVMDICVPIDPA